MCNHCNIRGLWYSYTAVSENDTKLAQKLGNASLLSLSFHRRVWANFCIFWANLTPFSLVYDPTEGDSTADHTGSPAPPMV